MDEPLADDELASADPPVPPPAGPGGEAVDDARGRIFPCDRCGADLQFHIGVQELKCPFCGAVKKIDLDGDQPIGENDYLAMLEHLQEQRAAAGGEEHQEHSEVRCESCGGTVIFDGTLTSSACPYCGSPIQREKIHRGGFRVPVDAVLPFQVDQRRAKSQLSEWVKSRWFAPNDFKKVGAEGKFNGVYLPFWTYDSLTFTRYTGERGENYTVTVGTGKDRRTETRTRWYPASGKFQRFFDDVLVNATKNLPMSHIDNLQPWPLHKCAPFNQEFLAGYLARTYDIELKPGFDIAGAKIKDELRVDCLSRIGGDHQRLHHMDVRYDAVTFKHLLLPVWMLAYRYRDKTFNVFINAVTGEVQGDRPYSWVKILLAVIAAVAAVGTVLLLSQR